MASLHFQVGWLRELDVLAPPLRGLLVDYVPRPVEPGVGKKLRFRRSHPSSACRTLALALAPNMAEVDSLETDLAARVRSLESALVQRGSRNEMVASVALMVDRLATVGIGPGAGNAGRVMLERQLGSALDAQGWSGVEDAAKQEVHDAALAFVALLERYVQQGRKSIQARITACQRVEEAIVALLGREPARFQYGSGGLSAVPSTSAISRGTPLPGATIDCDRIPGWARMSAGGSFVLEKSVSTNSPTRTRLEVRLSVFPGKAMAGDPAQLIGAFWESDLRSIIPEEDVLEGMTLRELRSESFRRTVGNGLRCWFCGAAWLRKDDPAAVPGTTHEAILFLIESDGKWVPAFATLTGFAGAPDGARKPVSGRIRHAWLEVALGSLRGRPSGQSLFTPAELSGRWNGLEREPGAGYVDVESGVPLVPAKPIAGAWMQLNPDGTCEVSGVGVVGAPRPSRSRPGQWAVRADALGATIALRLKDGARYERRLIGAAQRDGGRRSLAWLPMDLAPTMANATFGTVAARFSEDSGSRR